MRCKCLCSQPWHVQPEATPIVKGRLAATDARWSLISQSVDDRTPAERGEAGIADARMAGAGIRKQLAMNCFSSGCLEWGAGSCCSHYMRARICVCLIGLMPLLCRQSKSRYDSISCFIHPGSRAFNDLPCETDEDTFALLQQEGVDEALAQHVSHLFTRDPLAAWLVRRHWRRLWHFDLQRLWLWVATSPGVAE